MTIEECINQYLEGCPFPGQLLESVDDVRFGERGGVISPDKVLLEVTYTSRWKVPKSVGERELREAEMRGFERAVSLLRQTGRIELANELDRAYMGLQKSLPPVAPRTQYEANIKRAMPDIVEPDPK